MKYCRVVFGRLTYAEQTIVKLAVSNDLCCKTKIRSFRVRFEFDIFFRV